MNTIEIKIDKLLEEFSLFNKHHDSYSPDKHGQAAWEENPKTAQKQFALNDTKMNTAMSNFEKDMNETNDYKDQDLIDYLDGHIGNQHSNLSLANIESTNQGIAVPDNVNSLMDKHQHLKHHYNTMAENFNNNPDHYAGELYKVFQQAYTDDYNNSGKSEYQEPEYYDWTKHKIKKP